MDAFMDFSDKSEEKEILIKADYFFEILKQGPLVFGHYYDIEEWGNDLYFAYCNLWKLVAEIYELSEMEGKDEIQIDNFILEIMSEYGIY